MTIPSPPSLYIENHGFGISPHLKTAWHVDQAILSEDDRVVVIRFGREEETQCMIMDEILFSISEKLKILLLYI